MVELSGRIVLVRVDFNVPMDGSTVMDDARIKVPVATVKDLQNKGAKVVLMSHMGKAAGKSSKVQSLRQLIPIIEKIYGNSVSFFEEYLNENTRSLIEEVSRDNLILLENLRFYPQEESCDLDFAKKLASLGDFFVNEAFSVSHRKHASVFGIPQFLPSDLGMNFKREIKNVEDFFGHTSGKRITTTVIKEAMTSNCCSTISTAAVSITARTPTTVLATRPSRNMSPNTMKTR